MWVLRIIVPSPAAGLMISFGNRRREARPTPARAALSPIGGQPGTNAPSSGLGDFLTALREGSADFSSSLPAKSRCPA